MVNHHQTSEEFALVANNHRIRNIRRKLELVFNLARRDVFAACCDDNVFLAVKYAEKALIIDIADIARMQPAINHRLCRFLRLVEIAFENMRAAIDDFTILSDFHFDMRRRLADRAKPVGIGSIATGNAGTFGLAVKLK